VFEYDKFGIGIILISLVHIDIVFFHSILTFANEIKRKLFCSGFVLSIGIYIYKLTNFSHICGTCPVIFKRVVIMFSANMVTV
jgi:hypothetical protein